MRYLALAIILPFSIFFHFPIDNHNHASAHHEMITVLDNQDSYDSFPVKNGNDDPNKIFHFTLVYFLLIIVILNQGNSFLIHLTRRKKFLTPVFYQSNYVSIPLLKN